MNGNKTFHIVKKVVLPVVIFLVIFTFLFFALNFVINISVEIFQKTLGTGSVFKTEEINIDKTMLTSFPFLASSLLIYIIIFVVSIASSSLLLFKIINSFGNLKKEQKGSARFTTFKEIQQQYRDVPDKGERFEGGGGVPVARYKDRLFIDDSPVNNMWVGTTRSGKGELGVFSMIDIYSRAKNQASMVLNDPKGELYSASKDTLEGLGYHVEVLNLMNPNQSMSYDLLKIVKQEFFLENYSQAQQYARSLAFMLYHDPKSTDQIWSKASTNLCTALILGLCEVNKRTPERITMYNLALMLSELSSKIIQKENGEEEEGLVEFFKQFPPNHPARLQFATYEGAMGATRASILMNTTTPLGTFTLEGIGKLTSQNSLEMEKIGFNHWLRGISKPLTRIYFVFSSGEKGSITTDDKGYFNYYHDNHIEVGESFEIIVGDLKSENKTTFTVENIQEDGNIEFKQNNEIIKITSGIQFEKPIAVFMIVPDYDETFNIIASLYVKQLYTTLARASSNVPSGKCFREVIFILDEFGNMPPIEGMTNMITVCLGRNIRFNLIIQAYSQLENLYGDQWKTIDGNCGNTLYLLTADESTAEIISKKLGEETIITKSRSGQTVSLNKSKTESVDSRRLMTSTEVMSLKEGEMLVIRVIKRQDKDRNRIKQYPIYLTGKTALKYRWEYLSDYYDTSKSINDIDIPCSHATTDLKSLQSEYVLIDYEDDPEEVEISNDVQEEVVSQNVEETEKEPIKKESDVFVKESKKRNMAIRQEKRKKEQLLNKKINEHSNALQVIQKGLLLKAFNNDTDKVNEYGEMGILDFRDIVLSNDNVINDKMCSIMLSKINTAIKQIEKDIEKEII